MPDDFNTCRDLLNHDGDPRFETDPSVHPLVNMVLSSPIPKNSRGPLFAMSSQRPRLLNDSHNAVYGILTFASDQDWPLLAPDYSVSAVEAFIRTIKALIAAGHTEILAWPSTQRQGDHNSMLLSWTPEFFFSCVRTCSL